MPRGPVHESFNLAALGVQALAYQKSGIALSPPLVEGYLVGYLLGTLWVTPDLDLAERKNQPRPLRFWGPLKWIWAPYGLLFRHRGLSHSWILGPLTRAAYLLFVLQGASYGLSLLPGIQTSTFSSSLTDWSLREPGWGMVLGYFVSQWLHLLLDGVASPRFKRLFPRIF